MESRQVNAPFIIDASTLNIVEKFAEHKELVSQNLEAVLIGAPTSAKWPVILKEKVAETILLGRFKYFDDIGTRRRLRVQHLEILTTGTSTVTAPLHADTGLDKNTAYLCDTLLSALDLLHKLDAFQASGDRVEELRSAFSRHQYHYNPSDQLVLGAAADIVRDVVFQSSSTLQETIDILFTSIVGIPCVLGPNFLNAFSVWEGPNLDIKVSMLRTLIMLTVMQSVADTAESFYARPVLRWNLAFGYKLIYLEKILAQEGQLSMNWSIMKTLSHMDHAQTVIETGVALKPAGMKFCTVGPVALLHEILSAIADVYDSQEAARQAARGEELIRDTLPTLTCLIAADVKVMQESNRGNEFGEWTSVVRGFNRETFRKFIQRGEYHYHSVATNTGGDVLFFIQRFGPWNYQESNSLETLSAERRALLEETVHGCVPLQKRKRIHCFESNSGPGLPIEDTTGESASTRGESDEYFVFQPCKYKPSTLNAVINEPGRILVRPERCSRKWRPAYCGSSVCARGPGILLQFR